MASLSHCAYCFEVLSAKYEGRQPPALATVEKLWSQYTASLQHQTLRPQAIDRLTANPSPASSSSSSVLPARSAASSTPSLASNASSVTSQSSSIISPTDKYPLFVTWDKEDVRSGHKSLRGCIGTFEAKNDLNDTLKNYSLIAALQDHRFHPIPKKDLPLLECTVTLLTNFEHVSDPLDWEIGQHGVRITFTHTDKRGRESRAGSTYLPDVIREQGWTKDEALDSLISKALDHQVDRKSASWRAVSNLDVQRYQGSKESLEYAKWHEFREWLEKTGRAGELE